MPTKQWQKIEDLFVAALDHPPDERAAFLTAACDNDAVRREVEALLASHQRAGDFMQTAVFEEGLNLLPAVEPTLNKGQRLGPYEILRELGRGGMGAVYLASRADDQFRKRVAIKLIKRGMDTDDIVRRFRNERQILASLNHPNIARLLDGGTTADGLPYFVMEYIEGLPLLTYCDQNQLDTVERLRLFCKICAAVQHAHQNLVVHRDLKPGNILISQDGEPKLLDFGIAKFLNPELMGEGLTQTETRFRILTPEYASPEQVRGQPITTASDVYSLGVILYELLTGQRPYKLKDSSPEEMVRIICDSEPVKPSEVREKGRKGDGEKGSEEIGSAYHSPSSPLPVSPTALRGDLDNIVLMALRKEPARRYKSVEQFSEDIERHLTGRPVIARKDTFTYRAGKFIGRNKVGVAAAALVLLALLAGLIATVWQGHVAAKERDQARQEKARAEQLNSFLQGILAAASPEEKGKDAKVLEVINDAAERIDTELANQPEVRAQALLSVGTTYLELGNLERAEKTLREALQLNSQLYGEANTATVSSMINLAATILNTNQFDEAEKLFSRALEVERKRTPAGSKELARSLFGLGELYVRRGETERGKPLLREAVSISEKISGETSADTAEILVSLGRAEGFSGDVNGAEAVYRRSIAVLRGLPRRYEGRLGLALLNLGNLLITKGQYDEAISTIREADGIYQKQRGEASIYVFYAKCYLCRAYFFKNDYPHTVETAKQAIDMGRQVGVAETPEYLLPLTYLAQSFISMGKAREGEPYLRQSFELAKKLMRSDDPRLFVAQSNLGECLTAQNRFAEAEPLVVESYEKLKTTVGEKNPNTITTGKRVITLYEKWQKPDRAAKYRAEEK